MKQLLKIFYSYILNFFFYGLKLKLQAHLVITHDIFCYTDPLLNHISLFQKHKYLRHYKTIKWWYFWFLFHISVWNSALFLAIQLRDLTVHMFCFFFWGKMPHLCVDWGGGGGGCCHPLSNQKMASGCHGNQLESHWTEGKAALTGWIEKTKSVID